MKYIILAIFIAGCGHTQDALYKAPELLVHHDEFVLEGEKRGRIFYIPLTMTFADLSPLKNIVGICTTGGGSIPRVTIDHAKWQKLSPHQREILVFHELGHCILDRDHNDAFYGGHPVSLMNSYLLDYDNYYQYRDVYLDELFR